MVGGLDVVAELSDETHFRKNVHADLIEIRRIAGDGLFTAFNHEPNWHKAHDILMPAFSLGAMRRYHATMVRVARGLIAKWDGAAGEQTTVDVPADMTRLTFDTIGLCRFGYDFESFRHDEPHPSSRPCRARSASSRPRASRRRAWTCSGRSRASSSAGTANRWRTWSTR